MARIQEARKCLEEFGIRTGPMPDSVSQETEQSLFSGDAPNLRELGASNTTFSLSSLWLPQLRGLDLVMTRKERTLSTYTDFFRVLPQLTLLQTLSIFDGIKTSYRPGTDKLITVALPRLYSLSLFGKLEVCSACLKHIAPGIGRTLDILAMHDANADLRDLQEPIRLYSEHYFNNRMAGTLYIECKHSGVQIGQNIDRKRMGRQWYWSQYLPTGINIDIDIAQISPSRSDIIYSVFQGLLSSRLDNVTYLDLRFSPTGRNRTCPIDPASPDFIANIFKFTAVETLYTTAYTMEVLNQISNGSGLILPRLRLLKAKSVLGSTEDWSPVKIFEARRRDEGAPIQVEYIG